jgi:hypothetical protein
MVERMDQEAKDIRQQSLKMSWYMRGGATYEDVLQMSFQERDLVTALIKDNLETTKPANCLSSNGTRTSQARYRILD